MNIFSNKRNNKQGVLEVGERERERLHNVMQKYTITIIIEENGKYRC